MDSDGSGKSGGKSELNRDFVITDNLFFFTIILPLLDTAWAETRLLDCSDIVAAIPMLYTPGRFIHQCKIKSPLGPNILDSDNFI